MKPATHTAAPEQPGQDALLHVHAVGGLLDDDALRAVDHLVGHFLAAVGRQAVHEDGALLRALAISAALTW